MPYKDPNRKKEYQRAWIRQRREIVECANGKEKVNGRTWVVPQPACKAGASAMSVRFAPGQLST